MKLLNMHIVPDSLKIKSEKIADIVQEGRFDDLFSTFVTWGIDFLGRLLVAIVLFFLGKWVIKKTRSLFQKIMEKREVDATLNGFLRNVLDIVLYLFLFILIINIVGAKTISIAALIGSAGLAIGLAVKDNLANFAGGVMLLFNKPFRSGDYIEAQSLSGTVDSIGILYTTLRTPDNKTIHIPNGPLSTGNIVNYSSQSTRRVDLVVNIEYGTDTEVVNKLLLEIACAHPLVLKLPEPFARLTKMSSNSLDFTLRVWTKNEDYWTVTHDLNEEIYRQANQKGLVIPFNQLTVHLENPNQ